jgi:hypothetical protein
VAKPAIKATRCRRRWLVGFLVLIVAFYVFRVSLLRGAAELLVIDEPIERSDYVLLLSHGDDRFEEAGRLYRDGLAPGVLFLADPPDRLERMGLFASRETVTLQELGIAGVPPSAVSVLHSPEKNDWSRARCLGDWMEAHLDAGVTVLVPRFMSRKCRAVFTRVLGSTKSGRLRWRALTERDYDESNWWRHKEGMLDVFQGYVRCCYVELHGEDNAEWRNWDESECPAH